MKTLELTTETAAALSPQTEAETLKEWQESGVSTEIIKANVQTADYEGAFLSICGVPLNKLGGHAKQYTTKERAKLEEKAAFLQSGGWWVAGLDPLNDWKRMEWGQLKPKTPRIDPDKNSPIKYETPWGMEARAMFLATEDPEYWKKIQESDAPIVLTEGAKKAGCLMAAGIAAIALPGITMGYRLEKGILNLIPELAWIADRHIIVCFDQDTKPKTAAMVKRAAGNLSRLFELKNCTVGVAEWDPKWGKGIDDIGKDLPLDDRHDLVRKTIMAAVPAAKQIPPTQEMRIQRLPLAKIAWQALQTIPTYTAGDGRYMALLSMMTGLVTDMGNDGREMLTRWDGGKGQWGMPFAEKLKTLEVGRCSLVSLWTVALSHGWKYPDPEFEQQWKGRVEAGESLEEEDPAHAVIYKKVERRLGGVTRFNELLHQIEIDGEELNPDYLRTDLAIKYGIQILGRDTAEEVMLRLSKKHSYHPVQEYFERVAKEHPANSEFLGGAATRYFGTDDPLYDQYLRKWLVSVVARVYQPGCKVDTVLTLQGGQGTYKSSFFKSLCHDQTWFDDSFTGDLSDKDGKLKFHFSLICEWAEVETIFNRRDAAACKNLISSATDKIRPPYGRKQQTMPRRSVVVATSNQTELLQDPTGDRRWWIVPVTQKIKNGLVAEERDKLWAAAVHAYRSGEKWHLDPEWDDKRAENNRQFQDHDIWEEVIETWIESREDYDPQPFTVYEVATKALALSTDKLDNGVKRRIGATLRRLGYTNEGARGYDPSGKRERLWRKIEKIENVDGSNGSKPSNDGISTEAHDPDNDPDRSTPSTSGSNPEISIHDPLDPREKKDIFSEQNHDPLLDRNPPPPPHPIAPGAKVWVSAAATLLKTGSDPLPKQSNWKQIKNCGEKIPLALFDAGLFDEVQSLGTIVSLSQDEQRVRVRFPSGRVAVFPVSHVHVAAIG